MDRLKVLDLTGCIGLKRTPDFSNFMHLEKLILAGCVKLTTIDSSIGELNHLTTFNIKGCRLLRELPEEVGKLQSLTEVIMPQTFQPFNLPETFGYLKSLSSLILEEHLGISQLPSSIGGLVKVKRLSLRCCVGIKMLPITLGEMEMLVELDLSMSGIVGLPDSIGYLKKLKVIRVSYTMIRKFPHTIGQVEMLEELHAKKCWDLTDENLKEIGKLCHLKILDLSYTHVSIFPEELGFLSHLQTLELGSTDLQEVLKLPSSLTRLHMQARQFPSNLDLSSLVNLDYLELSRLTVSREEPDPSWTNNSPEKQPLYPLPCGLSTLKCKGIRLLPPLSDLRKLSVLCVSEYPMPFFSISKELTNLTELKLNKCKFVEKIYLSLLKNLQHLELNRLDRLVEIQGLSKLDSLCFFRISDCYKIERLPNLSKLGKLRHFELEACPKIKAIEGIESMVLDNRGCTVLERFLDVSRSIWLSRKVPEYQVFLSFSGPDTSYSIVDVLYENLVRNQISVFKDDDILSSGDGINEGLPQALNDSCVYIPFLSNNYASSWWCLRELAKMVNCTSNSYGEKIILPIFYGVKPDDVKLKSTLYRSALDKHRCNFGNEVEEWEKALREVADIGGFNLNSNSCGAIIESVVEEVSRRLRSKNVDVPEHLIEDHSQIKEIIDKLDVDSGGVRFVGIHGMGGMGKTTIAKVVFNKLLLQFDGVSFLQNVRESSQHGLDGLVNLQKKLLSSVLGSRDTVRIKDISDGVDQIKRACWTKKVLIVLDDLDKKEQLQTLAGQSDWFGFGSRIIITTRDENILMTQVDQSTRILAYEVHEMEFGRALQLFCKHAFGRDFANDGYDQLAEKIVRRVGMLPLAVMKIGSILCSCDEIGKWEDRLKELDEGPLKVVRDALMISYEGLKGEEKEVFLDIACFFINEDKTYPVIMWDDCNYDPDSAIGVLVQRSMMKIKDNKFWMHYQLQDLGRHIILEEYPRKFSRVWILKDVEKILMGEKGNEDVKALSLTFDGCSGCFGTQKLPALPNLRFLRVKGIDFSSNFENISKLRWLSWQPCQMTFQLDNLHMSNLVVLDLSNSDIEDGWGGWSKMKINKLKVLDLKDCIRLKTTPDFSNFTSLEKLCLSRCVELTTIHNSIGKLNHLETLNIKGCSSLGELPVEIGSLESLTEIIMSQNIHPFKLPETFGDLQSLLSLILDDHPGISQLPNSIGGLVKVTRLSLHRCVGIKMLPCSIGKMKMLEELDLSKSGIVELPDSIGCMKKLKVISVSYSAIRKFPRTIGQVEMLQELHAKKCCDLTDENLEEIGKLSHLRILDLSYTEVSKFPMVPGCLSSLQTLEMSSSHLLEVRHLPPSLTRLHLQARHFPSTPHFTSLVNLDHLELSRLTASIEEPSPNRTSDLPEEPSPNRTSDLPEEELMHPLPSGLSTLKFRGPSRLPSLSNLERLSVLCITEYPLPDFSISENLIHLKELKLSKCKFLEKISGLSLLKNLERLDLNRLEFLYEIDGLSELESLLYLRISHCPTIKWLPDLSKLEKQGHIELEACPGIRKTEDLQGLELDSWGHTITKRGAVVRRTRHKVPKNQVFLSFMELDACYSFFDSLCKNLVENQISVFREDEESSSGDGIGEELPLDNSDIYIPILSKNYASSQWCLRELARMVECTSKSDGRKKILPIFYDVEIDDVKLKSDLYKSALAKHGSKFSDEVDEWEKALKEVADIRGLNLKAKSHGELIDLVVDEVLWKLNAKKVGVPESFVEDLEPVEAIMKLLDVGSGGVRFVGILGMDADLKTKLAKIVFNKLISRFDGVSFLDDIRESLQHGLINLQKKLLSSFVGSVIADQIEDDGVVMNRIKRVCETREVLIVLDNIDTIEQLQMLAGKSDWFGSGSRIIFTTTNLDIMGTFDYSSSEEDQKRTEGIIIYTLFKREIGETLQLFYNHAFKRDSPIEGYEHLAKQIFRGVHGHPLFVEVIGSYLYSHCSDLEPHGDKRRLWEDTLKQLEEGPLTNGRQALMISYKALEHEQKEVFLDIACFFADKDQTYPIIMWKARGFDPRSAIDVLQRQFLIKVTDDKKFWMHAYVRSLGRDIVQHECRHKVSRRWDLKETLELMETKERSEHLEALSLTSGGISCIFASNQLAYLPKLRFLQVKGIEFSGDFDNHLSELRWLSWQVRQTTFLATNFHLSKLVVLDLSNSNVEDGWGGWSQMKMDSLKVLDLTGCKYLERTPDFSNFLTLEMLILARCIKLTTIDSSIGKLTLLKTLNLEGCSSFGELPAEIDYLQREQQLKEIVMPKITAMEEN